LDCGTVNSRDKGAGGRNFWNHECRCSRRRVAASHAGGRGPPECSAAAGIRRAHSFDGHPGGTARPLFQHLDAESLARLETVRKIKGLSLEIAISSRATGKNTGPTPRPEHELNMSLGQNGGRRCSGPASAQFAMTGPHGTTTLALAQAAGISSHCQLIGRCQNAGSMNLGGPGQPVGSSRWRTLLVSLLQNRPGAGMRLRALFLNS
jgi:hypothetical protein